MEVPVHDVQKSKYVVGLVGESEFLNCNASFTTSNDKSVLF